MSRVRITIEFDAPDENGTPGYANLEMAIGLTLADALGEFQTHRRDAVAYVKERYPWMTDEASIAAKIASVEFRNLLAQRIQINEIGRHERKLKIEEIPKCECPCGCSAEGQQNRNNFESDFLCEHCHKELTQSNENHGISEKTS